jgi:outer membrane receptor protein involved in Fe transport
MGIDSATATLNKSFDLTFGTNFGDDRGNIVVSANYTTRGGITRMDRHGFTFDSLSDGCVTAASASPREAGVPLAVPAGQTCRGAGGVPGFVAGGSGDIPFARISGIPLPGSAQSNPALNAAYAAAGIGNFGGFGFTFDASGQNARAALDPQDRFNLGPDNYLVVPQERWMINAFSHYDFADSITGYLELHYSNNQVRMRLAPSNVGVNTLFDVNNPYLSPQLQEVLRQLDLRETGTITVTSGPATRTTVAGDGLAVVTAGKRYVEVGPRIANENRDTFRVTGGLRGDLTDRTEGFFANLAYDVYYTYARTETNEQLFNAISRSRLQQAELRQGGAAPVCNIFGANVSAQCATAIGISATNTTEAEMQVAAASLTGTLFDLPAGQAGFSFGAEWRKNSATYSPDSFLSSGDVVGFNAGLPTGGSITAKELFGEVRVPLIANQDFFEELTVNGAFRYSDYNLDGVGGVWTYLGGAEWRPTRDIAFRGQYQRAIRAPNVAELYGGTRRSVDPAIDPCSDRGPAANRTAAASAVCVATGVPAGLVFTSGIQPNPIIPVDFGGNPDVGEETSDTYTAGVVLTPRFVPGLRLSVDYFDISLEGAIGPLGGGLNNTLNLCYNVIQDANSEFCQAVRRDQNGAIIDPFSVLILQANAGELETSGVDIAVRYTHSLAGGRLDFSSDWTWTDDFILTPVSAFPNIQNNCVGSWGQTCGEPIPEWRGLTRVTWSWEIYSISVAHRYIDAVTNDRYILPLRSGGTPPALDSLSYPVLPSRNYFDLAVTIDVTEDAQLYGGARNILGEKPPVVGTAQVRANTWPATYDFLGTEFFFGAIFRF